jgi:hypothetical protein
MHVECSSWKRVRLKGLREKAECVGIQDHGSSSFAIDRKGEETRMYQLRAEKGSHGQGRHHPWRGVE